MKIYDVVILGAGASGLMCGAHLHKKLDAVIIDANDKAAVKLKISGGGKCNITNVNVSENNYDADYDLISYALSVFSKDELLKFLKDNGVEPVVRKDRYYFCKDSSGEIIDVLKQKNKNNKLLLNTEILELKKTDDIFEVVTSRGSIKARKAVVATGGKSFANLGASDIGQKIARSFGLDVKEFSPALVGLTLQKDQFWMKELSGLSAYVHIKVGNKLLCEEMLFAHKGISGPAVLSASLYWRKGDISIDFLPGKNIMDLIEDSKKNISSVIPLPKRLSKAILKALDIDDIECKKIGEQVKEKLLKIHNYSFSPAGNFGFSKAEVSRGGVLADSLNPYTLEANKVKELYFIGEVVDVTGELGGYNFQWAFSSAVVCAHSLNNIL